MFKSCLFFLILITNNCYGKADWEALQKEPSQITKTNVKKLDTLLINKWIRLSNNYRTINTDSTFYYSEKAISKARSIGYYKGIADAYLVISPLYISQANYQQTEKDLNEAIQIYTALSDSTGLSNAYKLYGNLCYQKGKFKDALNYLNKAVKIKLRINDSPGLARTYLSMGNVYDNIGSSSTALDYYFKSLGINTMLNNKIALSANYNNIGVVLVSLELYPQALSYYNRALKTWKQMGSYGGISTAYENIAEVLIAQEKYDQAIPYLSDALRISKKLDNKEGISMAINYLGMCYLFKNQYQKAFTFLNRSLRIATDNKLEINRATSLNFLAQYYNMVGDYARASQVALEGKRLSGELGNTVLKIRAQHQFIRALQGLEKYKQVVIAQQELEIIKKSLRKDESIQKFTAYNLEYLYAAKEKQKLLQQKANDLLYQQKINTHQYINLIAGIIVSAVIVIAYNYYRQKRKQQIINSELTQKNTQVLAHKIDLDKQASELSEINKLKDRLISIMAHDLRSPLTTLHGIFDLFNDETITVTELKQMVPKVVKQLNYTADFLDTLLFWVNSQMANFNSSIRSFTVTEELIDLPYHQEVAVGKGIALQTNLQTDLMALADVNSIMIVIRNLVSNAIKFSSQNDVITVSATRRDHDILFAVKDTGKGMSPEQRDKLFKKKVDSQRGTLDESGTGMGLFLCNDLIISCKGRMWVESELGAGSTFYFTTPLS